MKMTLLVTTTALLMATAAHAAPSPTVIQATPAKTLRTAGYWKMVFFDRIFLSGEPQCVVQPKDNRSDSSSLAIKYNTASSTFVHLTKPGWKIPKGTKVSVTMAFDQTEWTADGVSMVLAAGHPTMSGRSIITIKVNDEFKELFASSSALTVVFAKGTEKPWTFNLNGSREVMESFGRCVDDIDKSVPQPFDPNDVPKEDESQAQPPAKSKGDPV